MWSVLVGTLGFGDQRILSASEHVVEHKLGRQGGVKVVDEQRKSVAVVAGEGIDIGRAWKEIGSELWVNGKK